MGWACSLLTKISLTSSKFRTVSITSATKARMVEDGMSGSHLMAVTPGQGRKYGSGANLLFGQSSHITSAMLLPQLLTVLREKNNDPNSNGDRNQRWLISRVPGSDEFYHITNLFYGCLMGVYAGKKLTVDTGASGLLRKARKTKTGR